ncbi:MAG: SseB family protein, partial [Albidovulum sp.]
LVFSGIEAGALDVTFLGSGDPALGPIARRALTFVLPAAAVETAQVLGPAAPGTDPARPPRLR